MRINEVGDQLPYVDATVECVQLRGGKSYRPQIQLAEGICPACGEGLDLAESLVCEDCGGQGHTCEGCDDRLSNDDQYTSPNGDYTYCFDCWRERYFNCEACSNDFPVEDECSPEDGRGHYCAECYSERYARCDGCNDEVCRRDAHEVDGEWHCPSCTTECEDCGEHCRTDDATECDGEPVCPDCLEDRNRLAPLYRRLTESPRFLRSASGGRCALSRVWELVIRKSAGCNWDWPYFAALEAHELQTV